MKIALFRLHPSADTEDVWDRLEALGRSLLYSESENESKLIYGNLVSKQEQQKILKLIPEIVSIEETVLPEIDWESQWKAHGHGYKDGFLEVDISSYCDKDHRPKQPIMRLASGPGFGDLSHPTTRLVMRLMSDRVQVWRVLDIGCGSGVLSLAALAMGAVEAYGIDIDVLAIEHSRRNAELNEMGNEAHFVLPEDARRVIPRKPVMALMNMIQSEQVVAWESISPWHSEIDWMISSGILAEGRDDYLSLCRKWGYDAIVESEEEGWLGFVLKRNLDS